MSILSVIRYSLVQTYSFNSNSNGLNCLAVSDLSSPSHCSTNGGALPIVGFDPVSDSERVLSINTATTALVGCRCFRVSVVSMTRLLALGSPRRSRTGAPVGVGAPLGMGAQGV